MSDYRNRSNKKTKKVRKISREKTTSESSTDSNSKDNISNISETNNNSTSSDNIFMEDVPIIMQIPKITDNIFDTKMDIEFTNGLEYPRSEYGFHHWIHQAKNKTQEAFQKFDGKKKIYLVVNKYERYIDNYDDSIGNVSKTYFGLDKKPDILSRGFYKLWEILNIFKLIDLKEDKFVSAHLAEGPGSFIQATMFYREMFCDKKNVKNDKYHAITLHKEDAGDYYVPELEEKFTKYYENENPKRFILHKTFPKNMIGGSKNKDNGDLMNPKTVKLFGGEVSEKAHLVTGDGGFEWKNENVQEQEAAKLIIAQIVSAFKVQRKGGHFVCKFFESFTKTTIKIIAMLSQLYDKLYFIKPLTSRTSNSEKYVVCMNFKYSEKDKEYKNINKKLDDMLEQIHKQKSHALINNIFSEYAPDKKFIEFIIYLNTATSNQQYKCIGETLAFIKKEVYSGDEYHERRDMQIKSAKYWNDLFFFNPSELKDKSKQHENFIKQNEEFHDKKMKELSKKIVFVESKD